LVAAPGIGIVHAQQDLEEITVTSKPILFRPEDQTSATGLRLPLIDTPQSISVVSDEMLQVFDEKSAYEASEMIPGVSQGGEGYGRQQLYIRGQYAGYPRINGMQSDTSEFLDSFAVERIEFVRGPATVLYGVTGAFGGEINQILKSPKSGFHADFGYENGDFASRRYQADVTGSIPGTDDRLKARVVGAYTSYGIFQDTVIAPHNINKLLSGAISFDITPNTVTSVNAYYDYRHLDANDGVPDAVGANNTLYLPSAIPVDRWYLNDPSQPYVMLRNEAEFFALSHKFSNDWKVELKAANSQRTRWQDYAFGFGPAGFGGLPPQDVNLYSYTERVDLHTLTSNLSLSGKFDLFERTEQFFAAVEYENQVLDTYNYQTFGLGLINIFQDGGRGIIADGSPIPPFPAPVFARLRTNTEKDLRASVQFLLNPVDRLNVLVGALTQHTDQAATNAPVGVPETSTSVAETNTVGRFGATYGLVANKGEWLSDAKAYYSWSQGFLPNTGIFDAQGNPLTAPQKSTSNEIGLKTQWFNNRVDANIDAFYATRTNVPAYIFQAVGTLSGGFSYVLGGKNTYDGVDFEVLGEITKGWNVSFSESYIKALAQSLLFSQKLEVANVPKNQISLFTSYEWTSKPLKGLMVGASVVNKSDQPLVDSAPTLYADKFNPRNQLLTSSTTVGFMAQYRGFEGAAKGLQIYANVHNAFNSRSYYTLGGDPGFSAVVGPPRAVTVGIRYVF
jgi:iron complex outermembrane receptor protein